MALAAIEFQGVGIQFDDNCVLKNVNFSIPQGEKFVIIGPSGVGKSVLLKLIGGILLPSEGKVLINGIDINAVSARERDNILRSMGMLFQKNALFDSLTSAENIAFPLRELTKLSEKEIQKKIDNFLEAVAIPNAKNLYPDEISGGMQKRLGIARALALDPEIILYDDPTAGLDPITSRLIINLIDELQRQKKATLVAITNDMKRAYQLADRIGMMIDGGMVITGNENETRSHSDPRVQQFITGQLLGPLTEAAI